MNKTIWKFELTDGYKQSIAMPKDAEILSVQQQHDVICIWALVDTSNELENRLFELYMTGENIYYDMGIERKHISTLQRYDGNLVIHLFERL